MSARLARAFPAWLAVTFAGLLALALGSCSKGAKSPTSPPPPQPVCALDHTALAFGSATAGTTKDLTFAISNTGGGTLAGTVHTGSAVFVLQGDSAYSLEGGAQHAFTVRFMPTAAVAYACTLKTGSDLCASVVCSGTGQAPAPLCHVVPVILAFGQVEPFCSKRLTLEVANFGTGILTGAVHVPGPDFSVVEDSSYNLTAGEYATFHIRFSPRSFGGKTAAIVVGSGGCDPVAASGTGAVTLDSRGCGFSGFPTTLDFGDVCVGSSVTREVDLAVNAGPDGGEIPVAGFTDCPDAGDPDRALWQAAVTPTLLPSGGGGAHLQVTFTPTKVGSFGSLVLLGCGDTGAGGPAYTRGYILCSARGSAPPNCPSCAASPTTLSFGQVSVGQTKDLPLQITNMGGGTLAGSVGPSHCPVFSFLGPTAYSLGPGQSASFTVRYTPAEVGITSTCNQVPTGPGCSDLTLIGEAVGQPSCAVSTTLLDFGSVVVGQSKDLTFDVRNAGGGQLCGSVTESCPDFSITQNDSYCFTPPAFVRVTVHFAPGTTGFKQCTISPGTGCSAIMVQGTGM